MFARLAEVKAIRISYSIRKIDALTQKSFRTLRRGWKESAYNDLENARKLAEEKNLWFEELWILLIEVQYFLNDHKDQGLLNAANARLQELQAVFDMPDDVFKSKFREYHIDEKIRKMREVIYERLKVFYDNLFRKADYMAAHMNYISSLMCCKAMGKIEMLTGCIGLHFRIERLFKMAIAYGSMEEVYKAMVYYKEALKVAREEIDKTYEYIALVRMLSICLSVKGMADHINLDAETMSAIEGLYALCDGSCPDPYSLGEELVRAEQVKAGNSGGTEADEAKWRIGRLRECMPMLSLQLALSRGDMQTACIYADELKEKEKEAYGFCCDFSNADMMMSWYAAFYNSAERRETIDLMGSDDEDEEDILDELCRMHFPEGICPVDQHRCLLQAMIKEMAQHHWLAAKALGEMAMEIASEKCSDYHIAMTHHAIGMAYASVDNAEEAMKYFRSALSVVTERAHLVGDATLSNRLLYMALSEMGNLTKNTNPEEAIRWLSDAIGLVKIHNKKDTYFLENCLLARAIARASAGDEEGKEKDCMDALDLIVRDARGRLPFVDKELRENYWAEVSEMVGKVVAQVDENSSPALRLSVYNAVLMAKGFLLSSEKAVKKAVESEESLREYIPLYKELEEYETSKLPWGTMTENSAGKYVEHYMKSMRLQMVANEVVEKYYDFMHIEFDAVAKALDNHDVVLDYYDYPLADGDQEYVAFVYAKGMEAPQFVKICRESDLQKVYREVAANKYSDGTPFHFTEAYHAKWKYSARLFNLLLGGVLELLELSRDSRIRLVPSGSLHKIPVESLAVEEGKADIVSDCYASFTRISHVRTLLTPDDFDLKSAGLFGGLDYGVDEATDAPSRGYIIGVDEREPTRLAPWGALRQTLKEVNKISTLWLMAKYTKAEVLTGLEGTPEKFRELSVQGCSVLHLATHGFFETVKTKGNIPGLQGAFRPMDLAGIVMSNGNEGWFHGNNLHHEGLLTATDIAKMDLGKSKLVVLSACYTGDGAVRSDGVFGLQRAFKKAGASCLVMSLWTESDEAGAKFMSAFYEHLLLEKLDKNTAFELAKKEIRQQYTHPMYWANFVMID